MNKMPKWVTQEDGTKKRTTIGEYNKEQVKDKVKEIDKVEEQEYEILKDKIKEQGWNRLSTKESARFYDLKEIYG